jgi:hypothetical protein
MIAPWVWEGDLPLRGNSGYRNKLDESNEHTQE